MVGSRRRGRVVSGIIWTELKRRGLEDKGAPMSGEPKSTKYVWCGVGIGGRNNSKKFAESSECKG